MRYWNIPKNIELENNKVLALDNNWKLVSVDASWYNWITGQWLDIWWETFSTKKLLKALQPWVVSKVIVTSNTLTNWTVTIQLYYNNVLHNTLSYTTASLLNWKYHKVFSSPADFTQINFNMYDTLEIRVSDNWSSLSTDLKIILW